ncbi:MAG: hypothetical protein GY754_29800 [bacterium]|nr:hypothetical protein [bacterium]
MNTKSFALFFLVFLAALVPGCEEGLYQSSPAIEGSIVINNNKSSTYSRSVTLSVNVLEASEMRFSNDGIKWSEWEPYASSKEWILEKFIGEHTVFAGFRKRISLRVVEIQDSISVLGLSDFLINYGSTFSLSNSVILNVPPSDALKMRFSNDNVSWGDWLPMSETVSWDLPAGFGEKTVFAEFIDAVDGSSFLNDSISVTDPDTCGISLNNGAAQSFSRYVSLTCDVPGAAEMRFSNDNTGWSSWTAYSPDSSWDLSSGTGAKTVYGQFRDSAGNAIALTDSISLADDASSSFVINNNAAGSFSKSVALNSNVDGAVEMRFSLDGVYWSDWESYASSVNKELSIFGALTVWGQFRDAAGNVVEKIDGINLYDPSGISCSIEYGEAYTFASSVHLGINGTGAAEMCFSTDGSSWTEWESYSASKTWPLSAGSGGKSVYVKLRDSSGNELERSDSITFTGTDGLQFIFLSRANLPLSDNYIDTYNINAPGCAYIRTRVNSGSWSSWNVYDEAGCDSVIFPKAVHELEFKDSRGHVLYYVLSI